MPLELGSDVGGSLRCPAHFCGVYAHKPSIEIVPQRGSGPPETPVRPVRGDMAVIGPMARSAADLALELSVLVGPDELWDGIGYKLTLPPPRHDALRDFRVLVLETHPLCPTEAGIKVALTGLADRLAKEGCRVVRRHPDMPELVRTTRNYVELLSASFGADLTPDDRAKAAAVASALSPDDLSLNAAWIRGATMSHAAWSKTQWMREILRPRWQALFQEVDLLLCPPMPTVAFPHDHSPHRTRKAVIEGKKVDYDDQVAWSAIATSMGLPATVALIARSDDGLPIGVQIVGGYLQDRTTIAFAGMMEQAFGGFTPPLPTPE